MGKTLQVAALEMGHMTMLPVGICLSIEGWRSKWILQK